MWDDWLNRVDGKRVSRPSTVFQHGEGDELIRSYRANQLAEAADVVCDPCNHGWMSVLSNDLKTLLEHAILDERPVTLDLAGVVTVASFAYMKAAVSDAHHEDRRPMRLPRPRSRSFCRARLYGGGHGLPPGLQVAMAHYRRERLMENRVAVDEFEPREPRLLGFRVLTVTYVVGAVALQVTYPRWVKRTCRPSGVRRIPDMPLAVSVPIWPDVESAQWPPPRSVSLANIDRYRARFL